ncbi:hypothetical protein NGB36_06840 [Streptomyces sp. RB6PN25]|uniref:Secreted protein n=1 Tax=Streptomyces humicola TaxID=2953240 RepID=A0ABT1PRM2_9ACTN|nr:hypothetical protein [Streptomyces humicola]MCQ4080319.1 hypothetical protein [Streptomyces humicola]
MRRALATLVGALAFAGALSVPAHADGPGSGVSGLLGEPVKTASDIGGLHFGELPLKGLLG